MTTSLASLNEALEALKVEYAGVLDSPGRYATIDSRGSRRPASKRLQRLVDLWMERQAASPSDENTRRRAEYWQTVEALYLQYIEPETTTSNPSVIDQPLAQALDALQRQERFRGLYLHRRRYASVQRGGARCPNENYVAHLISAAHIRASNLALPDRERAQAQLAIVYWTEVQKIYTQFPRSKSE